MSFDDRLDRELLAEDLTTQTKNRGWTDTIVRAIEQLFQLDIRELFRQAGLVSESVVREAIDDIVVTIELEGNSSKIFKIEITNGKQKIKKFLVSDINTTIDDVQRLVRASWNDQSKLDWHDDFKVAQAALEHSERAASTTSDAKPALKPSKAKPKPKAKPKTKPNISDLVGKIAHHEGKPEMSYTLKDMTVDDFKMAAEAGKKVVQGQSKWVVFKTLVMIYLGLATLVTGPAGLAALVAAYFIFHGLDSMKSKPKPSQNPPQKPHDPREVWNTLYGEPKEENKLDQLYKRK